MILSENADFAEECEKNNIILLVQSLELKLWEVN
jgi:acetyl/propionyl-CoA carboxylase alpha subunit